MDRTKYIGGLDIGAIAGLNPWRNDMDVYMAKMGLVDEQEETFAMWLGTEMQPVLRKRTEKETGWNIQSVEPLNHPVYPWYAGSPDDAVYNGRDIVSLLEYKTTGGRDAEVWGDPGTDLIPDWVAAQCFWYLGLVPTAKWVDVPVLFMGRKREFIIYRVNRDDDAIASLFEIGRDFWENNILKKIPPAIDGSKASAKFLKLAYPQEREPLMDSDPVIDDLVRQYQIDKELYKEIGARLTASENFLKERIGDHAGVQGIWGKVTWKKNKDSAITDWMKAYFDLCAYLSDKGIMINDEEFSGKHTTIKPGSRVLRTYFRD